MYIKDGIACAGEPKAEVLLALARVTGELSMQVTFSTGETRVFNATYLLGQPVFEPLKDQEVFADYQIDHGVVTWCDGDVDIVPEAMYKHSFEYNAVA